MGESQCCKKYGVPLYGVSWVPLKNLLNQKKPEGEEQDDQQKDEQENIESTTTTTTTQEKYWLVLCGGGGPGSSGVPNSILLTQFDPSSNSLSQDPVFRLGTGTDLPYRMAVHPGDEGLVCSFPRSCRLFEWDVPNNLETNDLRLKSSLTVLNQLEDVGQQLALTFNREGSVLAAGSESGHLRVFKWPSMEVILDKADAHPSDVKDLDFSPDGKFFVSLGGGPCRIWDVTSSTVVASLLKENGETFRFCRFSQTSDGTQILYIVAMRAGRASIVSWNTTSWERFASKQIDPVTAFNVSADGKFLAIGTDGGDISIITSTNMRVVSKIKKAHMGIVTIVKFSEDSRYLVSTSFDSSVRVTLIEDKKKQNGVSIWVIMFVVMLAILAYYMSKKALSV